MLSSLLAQVSEPSLVDVGGVLLSALSGGQYALLGAAALLLLVLVARKGGAKVVPWLGTPRGGAVLALALAGLTSLVARLSAGAPLSLGLFLEAVVVALSASGLWSTGKALVEKSAPVTAMSPGICTPIEIANGTCKP
jgi:hypothetical protein